MRRLPRPVRRLVGLFAWRARERDMDAEMAFHVESLAREYERDGLTAAEARRTAQRRFGDTRRLKERGHDIRRALLIEAVGRDIRLAIRGWLRSPGFAVAVVLTLALGIGGNTAIFSVVDQLLLRPLPYPHGDQLVVAFETGPWGSRGDRNAVSPANWLDWQHDSRTLSALAAWRSTTMTLTGVGAPIRLHAQAVSSEFFPLLAVVPAAGRTVSADDDRPNAPRVVVLSDAVWRQRFSGDPAILGRHIDVDDTPAEIIGVMPAGFRFLDPDVDLWTALRVDRRARWRETAGRFINVVGRVRTGTTIASARVEMAAIGDRLAMTYDFNKKTSVMLRPLREELTGPVRTSVIVLYAAVGLLLAIACFNVASLFLARAASRRREVAIRAALGAGRLAIVRQCLIESLGLAGIGGLLGIGLARGSLDALRAVAPPDGWQVSDLSVDRPVLLYACALSIVTGVAVGLVPALSVVRRSIVMLIREGGRAVTASTRLRQGMVVGQVALTVLLVGGAGLLVRTVVALARTHTGLDPRQVLTMDIALPLVRYTPRERTETFYRDAVTALRSLPGVSAAAAADSLPIIGAPEGTTAFHILGTPDRPMNDRPSTVVRIVTPGYFATLGIPILRGREFTDADDVSPTPGFVVNEAFANRFLPAADPLSARLVVWMQAENPDLPILGIVGNVAEGSIRADSEPTVYYSHRQMLETAMTVFVRTDRPAAAVTPAVDAMHRLDPNLAVTNVQTLEHALSGSVAEERLSALISGGFAVSGLVLVVLGLYGLLAFLVAERSKEIGVRLALGARPAQLMRSVVGTGLRLAATGALIGVLGSLALFRLFRTMLFGVTPYDTFTYAAVLALLGTVACLAAYVPARRAAHVDPLTTLRHD